MTPALLAQPGAWSEPRLEARHAEAYMFSRRLPEANTGKRSMQSTLQHSVSSRSPASEAHPTSRRSYRAVLDQGGQGRPDPRLSTGFGTMLALGSPRQRRIRPLRNGREERAQGLHGASIRVRNLRRPHSPRFDHRPFMSGAFLRESDSPRGHYPSNQSLTRLCAIGCFCSKRRLHQRTPVGGRQQLSDPKRKASLCRLHERAARSPTGVTAGSDWEVRGMWNRLSSQEKRCGLLFPALPEPGFGPDSRSSDLDEGCLREGCLPKDLILPGNVGTHWFDNALATFPDLVASAVT